MSNKLNNKTLFIALAILLAIFAFAKWYKGSKIESTINTQLVKIDTVKVSKILLYPTSEQRQEIAFSKEKNGWKVSNGKVEAWADEQAVNNLLNTLSDIKPQRLAAKSAEKLADYQLTDTTATRVKVLAGKKVVADVFIGKFTYQQAQQQYGMPGGGGGIIGTSYVRLNGSNEVYAVEGFLVFTFNQAFNSFRNQSISKLNKLEIEKIEFQYPADSSFILNRLDNKWFANNVVADSASVDNYLNVLGFKASQEFIDGYTPTGPPVCKISIESSNKQMYHFEAYAVSDTSWAFNSSQNPGAWFSSGKGGVFAELFPGKKKFLVK